MTHQSRIWAGFIAVSGLLLATGCSSSSADGSADESFLAPTSSTTESLIATTTTEATTTTTTEQPTTTTTQPDWTDEELSVIVAHDQFRASYFSAATEPGSDVGIVRDWSTPSYGDALVALLEELRTSGAQFEGTYDYTTSSVEFVGEDAALITTCVLDNMARRENGEVVTEPLGVASYRETLLELKGGTWMVSGANGSGTGVVGQSCDR